MDVRRIVVTPGRGPTPRKNHVNANPTFALMKRMAPTGCGSVAECHVLPAFVVYRTRQPATMYAPWVEYRGVVCVGGPQADNDPPWRDPGCVGGCPTLHGGYDA